MSRVKFGDVVKRININVDRFNTDRLYYIGKGATIEPDALTVEPQGRINATLGFKFHFGFNPGHILFMSRCFDQHKAATATFAGICSDSTYVVETKDESVLLQRYLQLEMQSDRFWRWCEEHKSGGVNYLINYSTLETYEFTLPSLSEQKVLAEKLWAAYEVKQSYLKMIAATEEMVKAQFIEMFDFHELNLNSPSKDFESMCFDDTSSATKIPAGDYLQKGKYAIYDQAQEKVIAGYYDNEQGLCRNYPAILFGDHSRVVKYIKEPFFIGADGVKIIRPKVDNLTPEFLYYDLKYHNIPNTGYNRHFKYIKMLRLTKASLEDQSRFLSIAHQADKSISELRKSVDAIDKVIKSLINENL